MTGKLSLSCYTSCNSCHDRDCRETDNISRDSGHSSAGTPPLGPAREREQEWVHRRRRQHQPDTVSLCERGAACDTMSVHSLDMRRRHGDRFLEDRRPAIIPRKSLMIQNRNSPCSEATSIKSEVDTASRDRQLQQRGYLVIALSIVVCCCLLTCSTYLRNRCDSLNMVSWDLRSLNMDLKSRVVGQEQSVRLMEGWT